MTVDLRPWLDAVPDAAANAIASARHALVVCHENPDADTLGAALGVAVIVERHGGRATLISTDPVPPLYDFLGGMDRFRTDPEPDGDYDLLVVCDCGSARSRRRGPGPASGAVRAAAERDHRPPRLERRTSGPRTGSTRLPPRRASWSRCSRRGSASRSMPAAAPSRPALMAGIVMDTSTFAAPELDAAHARRLGRAASPPARRCRRSRAACTARSRMRSSGCSGACSTGSRRPPAGSSSTAPCSTRT